MWFFRVRSCSWRWIMRIKLELLCGDLCWCGEKSVAVLLCELVRLSRSLCWRRIFIGNVVLQVLFWMLGACDVVCGSFEGSPFFTASPDRKYRVIQISWLDFAAFGFETSALGSTTWQYSGEPFYREFSQRAYAVLLLQLFRFLKASWPPGG